MIKIPKKQMVQSPKLGQARNASEGTQAMGAFGELVGDISEAGNHAFETGMKLQNIENGEKVMGIQQRYREAAVKAANERLTQKDSSKWKDGLTKHLQKVESEMFGESMSEDVRKEIVPWTKDFTSKEYLKLSRDKVLAGVNKAARRYELNKQTALDAGDLEGGHEILETAFKHGIIDDVEFEAQKKEFNLQYTVNSLDYQRETGYLVQLEDMLTGLESEVFDIPAKENARQIRLTKTAIKQKKYELANDLGDKILSDEITNQDEIIDAANGSLPEKTMLALREMLLDKKNLANKETMATPFMQDIFQLEIDEYIERYKEEGKYGEGVFDDLFVMQVKADRLTHPALKKKYDTILKGIKSDLLAKESTSSKSKAKPTLKDEAAESYYNLGKKRVLSSGIFKSLQKDTSHEVTYGDALKSVINDRSFAQAGYSDAQIQDILAEKNKDAQLRKASELWEDRKGEADEKSNPFEIFDDLFDKGKKQDDVWIEKEVDDATAAANKFKLELEKANITRMMDEQFYDRFGNQEKVDTSKVEEFLKSFQINYNSMKGSEKFGDNPGGSSTSGSSTSKVKLSPKVFLARHSTSGEIKRLWKENGQRVVRFDSNSAENDRGEVIEVISPLVVVPDDASPKEQKAALHWATLMAAIQEREFGRKLKPRIVSSSKNGRGIPYAFHTEGWGVNDKKMMQFIHSDRGRNEILEITQQTLGTIPGVLFTLPHSEKDPGAVSVDKKYNEVNIAKYLFTGQR